MKKTVFSICLMILSLSFTSVFAVNPKADSPVAPAKTENRLSDEEISRLTKRVEEIRDMDKSNLTVKERRDLRNELKAIKENVKRSGGYLYVGVGTILVILLLVILLV